MKKSVLLLLALWLCNLTLMATTVSQQRAKQIAAQFLSDKSTSHRSFSASQMQTAVVFDAVNGIGKAGIDPLQKIVMNIAGGDNVLRVITITVPQNLKDGVWYDLQGRKYVNQPTQRGIYILNGKKILIK